MPITEISLAVIALAVVVVSYHLVPAMRQLKKTLDATDRLVEDSRCKLDGLNKIMEDDVRSLVNNLNETVEMINGILSDVRSDVEKVEGVVDAVAEVGDTVRAVNEVIDRSIRGSVIEVASYIAGIKAVVETLYNAFGKLRRKEG